MPDDQNTSALIAFAKEALAPAILDAKRGTSDACPVMVLPGGLSMYSLKEMLDEYATKPERRRGETVLNTVQSLVDWTKRHMDGDSVVMVDDDPTCPKMRATIDYHKAGSDNEATARFGKFSGLYQFPITDAWKRWTAINGKPLSQTDFAELIEDRVGDLIPVEDLYKDATAADGTVTRVCDSILPSLAASMGLVIASPTEVIAATRGLKLRAEVNVTEAISLASGETELKYAETHTGPDGQPLKVPSAFLLGVSVFKGAQRDPVLVRLRYRRAPGGPRVQWTAVLHAADEAFEAAISEAIDTVTTGTGLPVFRANLRG
jgi:uncharacterized protein YfdQ (DUF2303 family)